MAELPINQIICGDCLEELKKFPENSIDTIITDPPYGIGFMGKEWDNFKPTKIDEAMDRDKRKHTQIASQRRSNTAGTYDLSLQGKMGFQNWFQEISKEMLRVAKPGATLLCFGGTRTHHRLMVAIEDAGWEIKDVICWIFGSGFPKSLNIGKQLQKKSGKQPKIISRNPNSREKCDKSNTLYKSGTVGKTDYITELTDENAKLWNGWGTALKPAVEFILVAMKPNEGSYAENALKWGVSGLNIDGGRIGLKGEADIKAGWSGSKKGSGFSAFGEQKHKQDNPGRNPPQGRFPANLILSCICDEVREGKASGSQGHWSKTKTSGFGEFGGGKSQYEGVGRKDDMKAIIHTNPECPCYMLDEMSGKKTGSHGCESGGYDWVKGGNVGKNIPKSQGGASRFFYVAKSSRAERNMGCEGLEGKQVNDGRKDQTSINMPAQRGITYRKNSHPTVKPLKLMEYLCILTKIPTGGIVLDPFAGSCTTAMACKKTKRSYIMIEKELEYVKIGQARVDATPNPLF